MSNRSLKAIFISIFILLSVYVLAHRIMVVAGNINPWKLGGMAMYTNVHVVSLDIRYFHDKGELSRIEKKYVSNETTKVVDEYVRKYNDLGKLVPSHLKEEAGHKLLHEFDDMDSIQIWLMTVKFRRNQQKAEIEYDIATFAK